ncbi:unnamed protein product [Phyllotreta striolata]|uniref:Fatty acid hydroxylase domain-containing protein n=1 Tax=Phyllotreta striolata TaxID=444603 RepID=A0A9N9XTI4_PHYSR|nr:unnamed protein product [Phyllotreta striolata]
MGAKEQEQTGPKKRFYDPLSVTWLEKHDEVVSKIWKKIPYNVGRAIATIATFLVGISINGDWINLYVHVKKQFGYISSSNSLSNVSLEDLRLQNFWTYWIPSCVISYSIYFGVGGFLHWYYYVRQRDRAEEWKCQPKKWLSPDLERHEIILGSFTLLLNLTVSAILACYLGNGGWSMVYYKLDEYGWFWLFLQFPVVYIILDFETYWIHRIYHFPFLYKHFHKLHHKYKQPTAFSVTAIHPVEAINIQCLLILPLFSLPLHWFSFYIIAIYNYYHGIIDHSGINFKAYWWQPWQPDAIFHDNHHQYFHVNFGFNLTIWDKIFSTHRQKDRFYREDTFYGKGKLLNEITEAELQEEIEERESENPLAYRENENENKLTEEELKKLKKK